MKAGISLSMTSFSSDYHAVTTDTLSMIRLSLVKSKPIPYLLVQRNLYKYGLTSIDYGQYRSSLFCKPSKISTGISLTLISSPRNNSQLVISVNSSE
jgi:hypothetical protein